jgi:HEPN domain-containing protein
LRLHYKRGAWEHSVYNLLRDFAGIVSLADYEDDGLLLDKLYIATRYPNGLPGLSPHEAYRKGDAQKAIEAAERIVEAVSTIMACS